MNLREAAKLAYEMKKPLQISGLKICLSRGDGVENLNRDEKLTELYQKISLLTDEEFIIVVCHVREELNLQYHQPFETVDR